ncbi:MAG: hypothetical protein IJM67_04905, partial [Atopobiaceae bacterium]|nr:hypothetical protein [Atopobiaceae bacterium]
MSYPLDLPDALAELLPSRPSIAEAEGLLLTTDGCQKLLLNLAEAEMRGQDAVACGVTRRDVCYHMHEEFPDEVGHDWFLTLGLFEPGREGIVALGPTVVSAFPSADDPATYICNVFRCENGKILPVEEPAWEGTPCLAQAVLKCIGNDMGTPLPLGYIDVLARSASDCDLDPGLLAEDVGIPMQDIVVRIERGMARWMERDAFSLAERIADAVLDPYEVADGAEPWQAPDMAWDEAVDALARQLATPSGREFLLGAVRSAFDDDAIGRFELKRLADGILAFGPASGFPLGQTTVTHGFMVTDYVRAALDAYEQDALEDALIEVLSEGRDVDEARGLAADAMESRISDISCMDAAG